MRTKVDLSSFLQIRSTGNPVVINGTNRVVSSLAVFPFITCIAAGGPVSPYLFPTVWRPEHGLCWQRGGNLPAGSEGWIMLLSGFNQQSASVTIPYNNGCQNGDLIDPLQVSSTDVPAAEIRSLMTKHWKCILQIFDTSANDSLRVCQRRSCTDPNRHKHGWNP